jgi:hypothetical protein
MGKKKRAKRAKVKRWQGRLEALPAIDERALRAFFSSAAPSLCALVDDALGSEDPEERQAARMVVADLRQIARAVGALLEGRDVMLSEDDPLSIDVPDRVIGLSRLLRIDSEAGVQSDTWTARHLIGCRLESMVAALGARAAVEARA